MPRARKDSDSDAGTDEQGTVGTFETLRDEGEHFVHVKQYGKAIESFTKALEMKEGDKTCLVVRSKCYLMLGNSEKSLQDADAALEQDEDGKRDIRALNMKAESMYQKGEFESALIWYHRGNKLRPELQEFRLGIQKCTEAINNSIGDPSSVTLEAKGDLSYFYKQEENQNQKKKQQQKGYTKVSGTPKKEEKKERQRPKDGTKSKTTKELLGELYMDKEYLENLFDCLSTSNSDADDFIKGRACDGLEYLNVRSDFWRQQKPMYARYRDKQAKSDKAASKAVRGDSYKYVLQRLQDIDEAQSAGCYSESLSKSQKTLKKVEGMSDEELKNKQEVLANLYSCMGNAYLELQKYTEALNSHEKDLEISRENDLSEGESRALDNLGRTRAKMGHYEEAVQIWKKKLPKSKSALESTWLYHEIGRCHLELGRYEDAKEYGEKSLAAAKEADDQGWKLHACVLLAQSEVKCGELEAASDSFNQALELAEDQSDKSAQTAIKRALQEVNDRIVKGGSQEEEENLEQSTDSEARKQSEEDTQDSSRSQERDDSQTEDTTTDTEGKAQAEENNQPQQIEINQEPTQDLEDEQQTQEAV